MIAKVLLMVLLAEIFDTTGQIFYRKGACSLTWDGVSFLTMMKKCLALPQVWFGCAFIGVGLLIFFMALSQGDFSFVYPAGSMQYVLILIGGRIFLGEKINPLKLSGTLLIILGIILITQS